MDITDVGMVSAVIDSFSNLMRYYQELQQAREKMMQPQENEDMIARMQEAEDANRALYETAKGFITRVLGIEGYEAIFKNRKPNSAEHMEVCNFIYANLLLNRNQYIEAKMQEEEDGED